MAKKNAKKRSPAQRRALKKAVLVSGYMREGLSKTAARAKADRTLKKGGIRGDRGGAKKKPAARGPAKGQKSTGAIDRRKAAKRKPAARGPAKGQKSTGAIDRRKAAKKKAAKKKTAKKKTAKKKVSSSSCLTDNQARLIALEVGRSVRAALRSGSSSPKKVTKKKTAKKTAKRKAAKKASASRAGCVMSRAKWAAKGKKTPPCPGGKPRSKKAAAKLIGAKGGNCTAAKRAKDRKAISRFCNVNLPLD